MPQAVLFVPGFWEGPKPFEECSKRLKFAGHETHIAALPSCGKFSPVHRSSMYHDIASIRLTIKTLVETGQEVVLVLHSAAGFLGSAAMRGLSVKERQSRKLTGGVSKIVFLCAGVTPEGTEHSFDLPFVDIKGSEVWCVDTRNSLFGDLSDDDAQYWESRLQPMPTHGWNDTIYDCGWRDVPSVYLVCKNDRIVPEELQRTCAALAGSRIVECDAGHMVQLSQPQVVVDVVLESIREYSKSEEIEATGSKPAKTYGETGANGISAAEGEGEEATIAKIGEIKIT